MKKLFTNAKVRLGNGNYSDAIGIDSHAGKIIFIGSIHQANNVKHDFDEVEDLKSRLVLPAFTDGHCHFIKGSVVNSQLNLRIAKTKKDFVSGINEFKKQNNGKWISGGFFSESNFEKKFIPDKIFLDEICSDIPVIISKFDMHSAFANSKALELSGIKNSEGLFTPEELIKNDKNELTGELKERARDFILNQIPTPSLAERTAIALKQLEKLNSLGITAISDITLTEDLEVYKEIILQNKLNLRVDSRLPFHEFANLPKFENEFQQLTDLIKFKSLKAFYDGSLSSKTALMHSNYKNLAHNGIATEFVNSGDFYKTAIEIDKSNFQMSVHAIGDKAVTELLDLNEELIKSNGRKDRRFRIEHAQHIGKNDFQRFKDLDVIASVQPAHLISDAITAREILEDYKLEHNYKKLFDIGAHVCFGTDFPVVSENPFETIYFAMTRKTKGFENGFVNENRISLENCLDAYTIENAYATFEENVRGNLQPGKAADIIVLENNLFETDESDIPNAKVFQTYFKGQRVY